MAALLGILVKTSLHNLFQWFGIECQYRVNYWSKGKTFGSVYAMIRIVQCDICLKQKRENLVLLGRNICKECEFGLLQCNARDSCYPVYLEKMKDIIKLAKNNETSIW